MPDVPLTAGPLSAAGPFPLLCSGLSLLPEPVLAAASVPPVLPLRVARSIRPAPMIRRSRTNLRPCGETLPPRLTQKSGGPYRTRHDIHVRSALYVSIDTKRKVLDVVKKIGSEYMTATSYVENIVRQHLELYKDDINRIYKQKSTKNLI